MICPKCQAPLDAFQLSAGPEIDVCPHCGGAWYDQGELNVKLALKGLKAADTSCPRCNRKMFVGNFGQGGPELDHCTNCEGVWLDQGELQQIRKMSSAGDLTGGGAPTAPVQPATPGAPPAAVRPGSTAPIAGSAAAAAAGAAAMGGFLASAGTGWGQAAQTEEQVICGEKVKVTKPAQGNLAAGVVPRGVAAHKPPPYGSWTDYWDEFLLFSPEHGYAWLIREGGHYTLVRVTKQRAEPNPFLAAQKGKVRVGGKAFRLYERGTAVLDEAEGETPWVAKPGDKGEAADCIAPPHIYSVERSGKEIEYFQGEYVEPEEVWKAFGLKGEPPERAYVHGCQPFEEGASSAQCKWWALVFAAVFAGLLLWIVSTGSGRGIFTEKLVTPATDKTVTTGSFRVEGKDAICRVEAEAPLDNQWLWLGFDVLGEGDASIGEFSMQLSYYHGRDSEGHWSEGSRKGGTLFKVKDPGTYRLRLSAQGGSGEAPGSLSLPVQLSLYDDYKPRRYFLTSLVIAALIAFLLFSRKWSFETKRWSEVIEDDDDDD